MAVFIKDNPINNKPNPKKIGNVSICFPTSKRIRIRPPAQTAG
jgi:hypothetical protein